MSNLLIKNGKLVIKDGKLVLASAECLAECCDDACQCPEVCVEGLSISLGELVVTTEDGCTSVTPGGISIPPVYTHDGGVIGPCTSEESPSLLRLTAMMSCEGGVWRVLLFCSWAPSGLSPVCERLWEAVLPLGEDCLPLDGDVEGWYPAGEWETVPGYEDCCPDAPPFATVERNAFP